MDYKQIWTRIWYFFPFQLVLAQVKNNFVVAVFWLILLACVTLNFANRFGIPYLFLYPEYMGEVGVSAHFLLGMACGTFLVAFNITSYVLNSFSFPFIATLSKPFLKFSLNNFIIPLVFMVVYLYMMYDFQVHVELESKKDVLMHILAFIGGNILFIIISFSYFISTNKSILELLALKKDKEDIKEQNPASGIFYKPDNWKDHPYNKGDIRVETYLSHVFKIALARDSGHYEEETLKKVFSQNHINASLYEVVLLILILAIGFFKENPWFIIPSGASVFIFITLTFMIYSALYSWFGRWATWVLIIGIVAISEFSSFDVFNHTNYAYGLNYDGKKVSYDNAKLNQLRNDSAKYFNDFEHELNRLNNWKRSNFTDPSYKPKLILLNSSGGGSRSSLWTYYMMAYLDSVTGGDLFRHTALMSGSSGGMLGAAYFRELKLMNQVFDSAINPLSKEQVNIVGKDLLNPVVFTMVVNDLFLRLDHHSADDYTYPSDRGYAFEFAFNKNTNNFLDKPVLSYSAPVYEGKIPMMILSPTIANDARRLLISSQPIAYLSNNAPVRLLKSESLVENIEFMELFKGQDARNLRMTGALRMNATFPYILPNVSLPSSPAIEVMDAGVRDNYGTDIALKYLYTFRRWIEENTSGIVLVQFRDNFKSQVEITDTKPQEVNDVISPIGAIYQNLTRMQNYDQDKRIQSTSVWLDVPMDVVMFQLIRNDDDRISLSWHLTNSEKRKVLGAVNLPENKKALDKLLSIMNDQ